MTQQGKNRRGDRNRSLPGRQTNKQTQGGKAYEKTDLIHNQENANQSEIALFDNPIGRNVKH